jgi:hypothetical protein
VYAILDDEAGNLLNYHHLLKHPKHKDIWSKSFETEIPRLATTTETIYFKRKDEIPANQCKDITYGCIDRTYRSKKKATYCTRITMGGNLVSYLDDCGTSTVDLLTVKLFNSVISTDDTKFMMDFYDDIDEVLRLLPYEDQPFFPRHY